MKPFDNVMSKVANTIDKTYSKQKSTYKGWAAFFKQFSSISRSHSSALLKLSENAGNHMGLKLPLTECLKVENPVLKTIISQTLYAAQLLSHLHLNLSERMIELSEVCTQQYEQVKKTKDHFKEIMRAYPQNLARANPRQPVEQQLLKGMFQMVDRLEQDQIGRTQTIRENSIMFYRLYKKIAEKQVQMVTANGIRISKMQVQSTRGQLLQLIRQVMAVHNSYPGASKLQRKNQKMMVQSLRSSLKMSRIDHTAVNIEKNLSLLQNIDQKYQAQQQKVLRPLNQKYISRRGILSKDMQYYHELSYYVKPQSIGAISYSMLQSYSMTQTEYVSAKSSLLSIKVRLRLNDQSPTKQPSRSFKEYLEKQYENRSTEERRCISHMMNFSLYHSKQIDEAELRSRLGDVNFPLPAIDFLFDVWIGAVFIDCLLETLFKSKESEEFLVLAYSDVFQLIASFGNAFLGLEPQLALIMFLQRVGRVSAYRDQAEIQPNVGELENLLDLATLKADNFTDLTVYLWNHLRNVISNELLDVYKPNTHPGLMVQIMQWLDLYFYQKNSLEQIMTCVRLSGYRYLLSKDPDRVLFGMRRDSSDKIRLLSEIVRNTEFLLIDQKILMPLAENIAHFYTASLQSLKKTVRQQFFGYIAEIILLNLNTINSQQLQDKDGYILNLGIQLCKIDQLNSQSITAYQGYFKIMEVGLSKMELEYKDLLQQTKNTELWIVEENMFATQNCYDFCSLLAKPIEFMVGVLKETDIEEGQKSEFTQRFVNAIKVKLNQILQVEVVKYVAFLESSLKRYDVQEPHPSIDARKVDSIYINTQEELKQNYFTYKQVCHRLSNLQFIKQQIQEIIKDLVDSQSMGRIGDIFGATSIDAEIPRVGRSTQELLVIVKKITRDILSLEERIIARSARATVFCFMRKLMERLYYQARKDDMFSGGHSNKLSEHTLMNNREQLEDYVILINRNVPSEYTDRYFVYFFRFLFIGVECEMLNTYKFRGLSPPETVYAYLNTDVANIVSTLKKQCSCNQEIINQHFYTPLRRVIELTKEDSKVLFMRYEQAMLNKNAYECQELLAVLNLRSDKDKKAKDFIKKYKP